MFDQLRPQTTAEDRKRMVMEAAIAAIVVAVIGVALVWFFGYYGAS
jgi:hypothetical protein